jgi:hypothetical protein
LCSLKKSIDDGLIRMLGTSSGDFGKNKFFVEGKRCIV